MILALSLALSAFAGTPLLQEPDTSAAELAAPIRLQTGDAAIDVTTGHAAPFVFDFDGDGVRDLLVGEYGAGAFAEERLPQQRRDAPHPPYAEGKLRIYRNLGTDLEPRFAGYEYLEAGGAHASIPIT